MKFDIEEFTEKRIAVNCITEYEATAFLKLLHDNGYEWNGGIKLTEFTKWNNFGEDTCYDIWCDKSKWVSASPADSYLADGYIVIPFSILEFYDLNQSLLVKELINDLDISEHEKEICNFSSNTFIGDVFMEIAEIKAKKIKTQYFDFYEVIKCAQKEIIFVDLYSRTNVILKYYAYNYLLETGITALTIKQEKAFSSYDYRDILSLYDIEIMVDEITAV